VRLDLALVDRGLVETRSKARALIMAGDVLVNEQLVLQAGSPVEPADVVALRAKPRFVSRGGEKLAHALKVFAVDPSGRVCADLGASTGGFTDCLLQAGAQRVYAIDVGYGQLDQRLRDDPRVIAIERTNARYLDELPEPVSLITVDVSFISLSLIFPAITRLLEPAGDAVTLIKPQFEAGREEVGKGGVVRDPAVHRHVLESVIDAAARNGLIVEGLTRSPLLGPKGNVEFLGHFRFGDTSPEAKVETMIERALAGNREQE
jgi:23S rRNA (cytidine1920-2'-O)/16S rRNA (cytidine1409-2'-O)-methyltransferase